MRHSGLPSLNAKHPDEFLINFEWSNDKEKTTNITLNLVQSEAVGRQVPLFTNDKNGKPVLTSLIDMKVS